MEQIAKELIILIIVLLVVKIISYITYGIILTKLGKLKGEQKLWRAWVPYFNTYLLGKVTKDETTGLCLLIGSLLPILDLVASLASTVLIINAIKQIKELTKNQKTVKEVPKNENVEEIVEELDLSAKDDFEIIDLGSNETIDNPLERRKENRIMLAIGAFLIIFALSLPTITNLFKKGSTSIIPSNNSDIKYYQTTEDGLLEINKEEGNITAKQVKFYNFTKRANNTLSLIYLPEDEIKEVNSKNIYIELLNSGKTVIYRQKFTSNKPLERKIQVVLTLNLSKEIYKDSKYAKISIIEDSEFNSINDILVCTKVEAEEDGNINYKVTYNFSSSGLSNYEVYNYLTTEDASIINESYKDSIKKEAEVLSQNNIENLTYDETSIKYKVNLLTLNSSGYTPKYGIGTTKKSIKSLEEENSWSCN